MQLRAHVIVVSVICALLPLGGCAASVSRKYSHRVMAPSRAYIATPAALSLPSVEVTFPNRTGRQLRGWFLPNDRSDAGVVLVNGNTGNMSYHLLYAAILWRAGFNVLLFDYQGFGRSQGRASLLSLADDGRAALGFLRAQPEVDPQRVGLFGISLGSVVALAVAAQCPGQVAAVAAEAPYDPRRQLARMLVRRRKYKPWVARLAARLISGFAVPPHFRPLENVERLTGIPVFFLHGVDDRLLPAETSLRLFLRAPGPKRLWLPERTGHSPELLVTQDGEYQAQIVSFFRQWLRPGAPWQARGFKWRVTHYRDGRFEVRIHPGFHPKQPTPLEIITIPRGGSTYTRHRIWVQGRAPIVLRPKWVPAAIAITPRHRPVRRVGWSWRPIPSHYTRSYRRVKAARPRLRRLLGLGPSGLAAAGRLLARLDRTPLDARIQPQLGRLFAGYGARLQRWGQLRRAARAYVRALVLAPANPRLYYELGDARFSHGPPRYPRRVRRLLRALRARLKRTAPP